MRRRSPKADYAAIIRKEHALQKLRWLIGTKKRVANRERQIAQLERQINDPVSFGNIRESTQSRSFSEMGERVVKGRLDKLNRYATVARPPLQQILPATVLRRLAFRSMDTVTERHFRDVTRIAVAIFDNLPLAQRQRLGASRRTVKEAANRHDEGKRVIPSTVLRKTARLTDAEFGLIRKHPEASEMFLAEMGLSRPVVEAGRQHHMQVKDSERRRGYPPRASAETLRELSKLVSVADAVEAMTAGRYDKPPKTIAEAIKELEAGKGTQFDPTYADALAKAFGKDKGFLKWWDKRYRRYLKSVGKEARGPSRRQASKAIEVDRRRKNSTANHERRRLDDSR